MRPTARAVLVPFVSLPAGKLDPQADPKDPKGGPWIMWAGTPHEHLMVPVRVGWGDSGAPGKGALPRCAEEGGGSWPE